MNISSEFISKMIEIILINLVLSGDNVAVISLSVKDLPPQKAKFVSMLGVFMALFFRIIFIGIIGFMLKIKWLHINLIGGIILVFITFNILQHQCKMSSTENKQSRGVVNSILSIIISDISMSLDNVLAIASVAMGGSSELNGQGMILVIIGVVISMPIIFFGSEVVSKLMSRFPVVIYVCAGLLLYTSLKMIFNDKLIIFILNSVNPFLGLIFAAIIAVILAIYLIMDFKRTN